MRNYYQILDLGEDCSADDIRQQYRTLAKKYHPDLNKSPKAHEQFIAVQRAYKTLSDPKRRTNYDHGLKYVRTRKTYENSSFQRSAQPNPGAGKTEAERNRNYEQNRRRAHMKKARKEKEDALYFHKFKKYAVTVSLVSFILSMSFFLDYALAPVGTSELVQSKSYLFTQTQDPNDRDHYRILTNLSEHRIHMDLVDDINPGDNIAIQQSPFYKMIIGIDVLQQNQFVRIKNTAFSAGFKFYGLLLIVALLTFYNRNKNEWAVNLTLLNLLLLAIDVLLLKMVLAN